MANDIYHGNSYNCTHVDQLMARYYLPVCYSIIFIVGLVGNITSISIYLTKLRPWKSSGIIMVNLALTDLLYILSMPFLIFYYSNGDSWTLGKFMCLFVRFWFHFHLYGSVLFLTCLAVFRFVVVIKPLSAAQMEHKVWGISACVAVWVIAAAEITPMLTMINLEKYNNKTYCIDFASTVKYADDVWWYNLLLTVLGFLLPLVVVFICYIRLVKHLLKGPYTSSPYRIRARRVIVLILVVFVLCFLPYHILRALRIEMRRSLDTPCMLERVVHTAYIISRPLAGFNIFFNLALYTLSGDNFRRAFLSIFYRGFHFSNARSLIHLAFFSNTGSDPNLPMT
ncbi:2-oxoglutarate receptor 1-like [Thalassophryne amazonica]|uniref:2-oxoglutarate receptor 1-like n=1 Tax=Thalassophryne amazonica TaxID=390379 RepID=UPI001471B6EE|nr:2-oxoglutarate receptor 1-like [Thalassophryne amazonica]